MSKDKKDADAFKKFIGRVLPGINEPEEAETPLEEIEKALQEEVEFDAEGDEFFFAALDAAQSNLYNAVQVLIHFVDMDEFLPKGIMPHIQALYDIYAANHTVDGIPIDDTEDAPDET